MAIHAFRFLDKLGNVQLQLLPQNLRPVITNNAMVVGIEIRPIHAYLADLQQLQFLHNQQNLEKNLTNIAFVGTSESADGIMIWWVSAGRKRAPISL